MDPDHANPESRLNETLSLLLNISVIADRALEKLSKLKLDCDMLEARMRSAAPGQSPFKDYHGRLTPEGRGYLQRLLASGHTQADAARELRISTAAVSKHVQRNRAHQPTTTPAEDVTPVERALP